MKKYPTSILPIGAVNLKTAKNQIFGVLWNGWEENKGANLLVEETFKKKLRVIYTSEPLECAQANYPVGKIMEFQHDQTRARIGFSWRVVGVFPHSSAGLLQLKEAAKCSSLSFSTFK